MMPHQCLTVPNSSLSAWSAINKQHILPRVTALWPKWETSKLFCRTRWLVHLGLISCANIKTQRLSQPADKQWVNHVLKVHMRNIFGRAQCFCFLFQIINKMYLLQKSTRVAARRVSPCFVHVASVQNFWSLKQYLDSRGHSYGCTQATNKETLCHAYSFTASYCHLLSFSNVHVHNIFIHTFAHTHAVFVCLAAQQHLEKTCFAVTENQFEQ